jgi:hypothetical protein
METTDPTVELSRQAGQSSRRHAKERVDLVRSKLHAELQTGASGMAEEVAPERGIREHATERPFNVSLTHSPVLGPAGAASSVPNPFRAEWGSLGVTSNVDV